MLIEAVVEFLMSIMRMFVVSFVMLVVLFVAACVVADIGDYIKKRWGDK